MNDSDFDQALIDWLAPPPMAPDRLFTARVDIAIGDLAQLHAAERHYARGFVRELLALGAVALAGLFWVRGTGLALDGWLVAFPLALLVIVLIAAPRHPYAGSSSAP